MTKITNPILKGFNPDPSIIRVGSDYYIATSTFEWFPGVQIHHSTDLKNWSLINRPLSRVSQLDMRGAPDSCGIWAPCLSYDDGIFYLIYTNVRNFDGPFKDTPNYVVTTKDIRGEWSEPIFLSSSGFDGSLFHDNDGKKYFLSMIADHRNEKFFGGILIQEYNAKVGSLVGKAAVICEGSSLGKTEGPHLYKKGDYYYLLLAEGGTEYGHAVSIARSISIYGPYELHPDNPIITASHSQGHPLQKNGHGDLVESIDGEWYCVYLVGRPIANTNRCVLGRETAISPMRWGDDGWIYSADKKEAPLEIEVPSNLTKSKADKLSFKDDFDRAHINKHFQSLRIPISAEWASLEERPGYLRMYGRDSLSSCFDQSLIAKRLQHFKAEVTTQLEFSPTHYQNMAGLVCYYNTYHWHYLHISLNDSMEKVVQVMTCDKYKLKDYSDTGVVLPKHTSIGLKASIDHAQLQFYYRIEQEEWQTLGPLLDMSILSDDYVQDAENRYRAAFTGSFVGICCQDLTGQKNYADFDWYDYQEILA